SEGNLQDKISVEFPDKQIVTVDNQIQLPTDYPDKAVEARLQAIESKQQAILDKLESGLDTRLTGSNVVKVDTLVNAETVDGEGNLRVEMTATNESYIML